VADFTASLVWKVENTPALYSLVGERFYPQTLPLEPELPAIVFLRLPGGKNTRGHGEQAGLFKQVLQLEFWSGSHLQSTTMEKTFFSNFDGIREVWGTSPSGISVQHLLAISGPVDLPDESTALYKITRDYSIMWKEI
jgi:hypothetical protein